MGRDLGGQQHGLAVPGAAAGGRHAAGGLWLVEAGHVTTVLTRDLLIMQILIFFLVHETLCMIYP